MHAAYIIPGFSGPSELLLILLVVLLIFGPKRLPELARSLRKSLNEFKKGHEDDEQETLRSAEKPETSETGATPGEVADGKTTERPHE